MTLPQLQRSSNILMTLEILPAKWITSVSVMRRLQPSLHPLLKIQMKMKKNEKYMYIYIYHIWISIGPVSIHVTKYIIFALTDYI